MSTLSQKNSQVALRHALRERNRAVYQEAILDAAEEVFLRDGFDATRMLDVAQSTGVSVGTLYNYFNGKEAVFLGLIERYRTQYDDLLHTPLVAAHAVGRLREFIERSLLFIETHRPLIALFHCSDSQSPRETNCHAATSVAAVKRQFRARLANVLGDCVTEGSLRRDLPLEELTHFIVVMLDSAIAEWLHVSAPGPLTVRGQFLLQVFLEGASQT